DNVSMRSTVRGSRSRAIGWIGFTALAEKGLHPMSSQQAILKRLRAICNRLPGAIETTTFGHPTFQAGRKRTFLVLDDHERADGGLCIVFRAALADQRQLTRDARFAPPKFGAKQGWTAMTVAPRLDWARVAALVTASYRLVAGKRMLAQLEQASRS